MPLSNTKFNQTQSAYQEDDDFQSQNFDEESESGQKQPKEEYDLVEGDPVVENARLLEKYVEMSGDGSEQYYA